MIKKILMCGALFLSVLIPRVAQAYELPITEIGTPITIHIDGDYLPCDVDPIMQNNCVLLPMRAVGEALGVTVDWNNSTQTVILAKGGNTVQFTIGSMIYYYNGIALNTDVPAQIVQNRTLIPLRVFAEALDTRVDWNQDQLDVMISTTGMPAVLPQIPSEVNPQIGCWLQKYYTTKADGFIGNWQRIATSYGRNIEEYQIFYRTEKGLSKH